jgi:hypothetical protein
MGRGGGRRQERYSETALSEAHYSEGYLYIINKGNETLLTCGTVRAHEQLATRAQELTSRPSRSVSQDAEVPEQYCTAALCPVVPLVEPKKNTSP